GRVRGLVQPVEKVCGQLVDSVLRAGDGDVEGERSVGFPVDEAAARFAVAGGLSDALGAGDAGSDHLDHLPGPRTPSAELVRVTRPHSDVENTIQVAKTDAKPCAV